jgi:DNA-binding beta-propeller fold protein YncE
MSRTPSRARSLSSMPSGKYRRALGSLKGGEGYFKRPTGIAVDSAAQRIYVTDTLRDKIFVLDMQGQVLQTIGKHGNGSGEFYFPTELHLDNNNLLVVDAMNFRVQWFGRNGNARERWARLAILRARCSAPRA